MKKFISIATLIATFSLAPAAFAGGSGSCHFHGNSPAKEAVVVGCAKEKISDLVAKAKIEMSWKSASLESAETVEGKSMKEWKLTFKNPAALEANKKTLYMFFTLTGNFIGANFDGK